MSYVIVIRNPSDGKLMTANDDDEGAVAEFETEEAAGRAAKELAVCQAWPFEVVEIEL